MKLIVAIALLATSAYGWKDSAKAKWTSMVEGAKGKLCREDAECSGNWTRKKCCSDMRCNAGWCNTRCRLDDCGT